MDRTTLYEPAGDDRSGISRRVYNIETGAGTYFAEGLLVHNSHRIKSPSGNASHLLERASPSIPRRVLLTGTVMPKGPMDVYAQWRFLDPYAFGQRVRNGERRTATIAEFEQRFLVKGGFMNKEIKSYQNLDELEDIMALRSLVAKKEDSLDLPEVTDVIVPVRLSQRERKAYDDLVDHMVAQLDVDGTTTTPIKLTQMLRLRQITSGHTVNDAGQTVTLGDSKAKTVRYIVQDELAGEKRVVVFCYFTHEIHALEEVLREKGTEVVTISGDTPSAQRMAIRKRFGSSDPARLVLVAQVRTMSLAVNELVTASHAVFASLSQRRDDLVQARDRLNRIGQTKPVTYWYAQVPKSIDDVILQTHKDGTDLELTVLNHIKNERESRT